MPRVDGIEATRRIVRTNPTTRVLVLTTFDLDEQVSRLSTGIVAPLSQPWGRSRWKSSASPGPMWLMTAT